MKSLKNKISKTLLSTALVTLAFFTMPANLALAATGPCDKKDPNSASLQQCLDQNPIINDIRTIINVLSAGVGVVVVGSIIVGSIQYILAGNNPNSVSAAKQRITNALIALLTFLFIYAFLDWLLPGDSLLKRLF